MKYGLRILLTSIFAIGVLAACGTPQQPPAVEHELAVTLAGTGSGAVTSNPEGIDTAAGDFDAMFDAGTSVTLTATANTGSEFVGFSFTGDGECEADSAAGTCVVPMSGARSVVATFALESVDPVEEDLVVNVVTGGSAAGTVTSDVGGIDVDDVDGSTTASFEVGTVVTLTAEATAGAFAGWTGGDCDGLRTLTCEVTVNEGEAAVTANFNDVTTATFSLGAGSDDAEEFLAASFNAGNVSDRWPEGHTYHFSNDLELGYDPSHGPQAIGLRFPGVAIPAGAIVSEAVVGFTAFANASTGSAGTVDLTITGQAAADAATFVGDSNNNPGPNPPGFGVTSRSTSEASVAWSISAALAPEEAFATNDIASIVQEIVDVDGWASGNGLALVFMPVDESSTQFRRAYSYDEDTAKAATLTVTFVTLPN